MNEGRFRKMAGLEGLVNEMFCTPENNTEPKVNAITSPDGVKMSLYYPGAKKNNFIIKTEEGNVISVKGEFEDEISSGDFAIFEFRQKSFERKFVMPKYTNKKKISATYENGVLEVDIPVDKKAEEKNIFNIEVQ